MKVLKHCLIVVMTLSLTASCTETNVLEQFSQKDSDEALFLEAKKRIDDSEWTEAIDIIEGQLSASFRQGTEVRETLASAYAGRCGVNFMNLINGLSNSDSSNLFNFFMGAMSGVVVTPTDCSSAQAIMETFGDSASRTGDQNLFMAILGMAKAGSYLRARADQDNAGLGDGAKDAGFDVCNSTSLPDASVVDAMVGFGLVLDNFATVSAQLAGASVTDIQSFQTDCDSYLTILNGTPTTCDFTDRTMLEDNVDGFRSMLNDSTAMGIGDCNTDQVFTACPCDGF